MNITSFLEDSVIFNYQLYLKLERSFSSNTVTAYMDDLAKLLTYLSEAHIPYKDANYDVLSDFLILEIASFLDRLSLSITCAILSSISE